MRHVLDEVPNFKCALVRLLVVGVASLLPLHCQQSENGKEGDASAKRHALQMIHVEEQGRVQLLEKETLHLFQVVSFGAQLLRVHHDAVAVLKVLAEQVGDAAVLEEVAQGWPR